MPTVSCAIMELPEHVFKVVIEQIAFRLVSTLDLVDIIGDNIYINTDFMSKTSTSNISKDAIINIEALRVDAQIQMNPTSQKWDAYTFAHTISHGITRTALQDMPLIYSDGINGVRVVEQQTPVTITMNCVFHMESAILAHTLPGQLRNLFGSNMVQYTDLFFDYPIPKPILHVIHGIYKQDRYRDKEQSFIDYIAERTANTWNIKANTNISTTTEFVKQVRSIQSLLAVEYTDDKPNANKTNESAAEWQIPIVLTVQFGMPNLNIIHYPAVIGNKLLPAEYISDVDAQRTTRLLGGFNSTSLNAYAESHKYGRYSPEAQVVHSPKYDDWSPPSDWEYRKHGHAPIAIIGILLDENETLHTTLDMKEFNDESFSLQPFVKDILIAEGKYALESDSIITLSVFMNDTQLAPYKELHITDDLVLSFNGIDINAQYRLVISVCRKVKYIDPIWRPQIWVYREDFDSAMRNDIDQAISEDIIRGPYEIDPEGNIVDNSGYVSGNINNLKPVGHDPVAAHIGDNISGIHFKPRVIRSNIISKRSNFS